MGGSLTMLHREHGAVLQEGTGGMVPLRYGELADEVRAIEGGVGILALEAQGVLLLRGAQAAPFLNGLVTNDVTALPIGRLQANLLCANKGKILHPLRVVRAKAEEYLLLTEPGELEPVAAHLNFYHIREEFQMGQVGLAHIDLLGPAAAERLRGLGLAPESVEGRFGEGPLVTLTDPLGDLPRLMALLPAANAPQLIEALLAASPPAQLVGFEAYDELRIWQRLPRWGVDYGPDHLPAEAALYSHMAFNKGCYVGQEIHARMHYRGHPNRKLVAVDIPEPEAAVLGPGAPLFREGAEVGRLTSLARLARQGNRRGIAMVRHATVMEGGPLAVAAGAEAAVTMEPLRTDLGQARR